MGRKAKQGGTHSAAWSQVVDTVVDDVNAATKDYRAKFDQNYYDAAEVAVTVAIGEVKFDEQVAKLEGIKRVHNLYCEQAGHVQMLETAKAQFKQRYWTNHPDQAAQKAWCVDERDRLRNQHITEQGIPINGVAPTHPLFQIVIDIESSLDAGIVAGEMSYQEHIDILLESGADDALLYVRLCQDEHNRKRGKQPPKREKSIEEMLGIE